MNSSVGEHKREDLIGTWKLVSASSVTSKGNRDDTPYGTNPTGFLTYTPDGSVTALIGYGGRKPLPFGGGTQEDKAAAFESFLAYAGRFVLETDKVIHTIEVSSIQNYVGKELVRTVRLEENRLTLTTPPTPVNGKVQKIELIWERASASH